MTVPLVAGWLLKLPETQCQVPNAVPASSNSTPLRLYSVPTLKSRTR